MKLYIVTTQHNGFPYYLKQFTPATVDDSPQYVWTKKLHEAMQLGSVDKRILYEAQQRGFRVHKIDTGEEELIDYPSNGDSGLDNLLTPRSIYV